MKRVVRIGRNWKRKPERPTRTTWTIRMTRFGRRNIPCQRVDMNVNVDMDMAIVRPNTVHTRTGWTRGRGTNHETNILRSLGSRPFKHIHYYLLSLQMSYLHILFLCKIQYLLSVTSGFDFTKHFIQKSHTS